MRIVPQSAWFALFASFGTLGAVLSASWYGSLFFSIIGLVAGFDALRLIYAQPEYFKGASLTIPPIVFNSFVFVIWLFIEFIRLWSSFYI